MTVLLAYDYVEYSKGLVGRQNDLAYKLTCFLLSS